MSPTVLPRTRSPQSAHLAYARSEKSLDTRSDRRCTIRRKQLFPPHSFVNRKASNAAPNESSKRDDATTVTRFRPRTLRCLCAYIRISGKRDTDSFAVRTVCETDILFRRNSTHWRAPALFLTVFLFQIKQIRTAF